MTDVPLTATDPLPFRPGGSSSPAAPDGPAWVPRPAFVALAATECWVVEWQYSHVRALLV